MFYQRIVSSCSRAGARIFHNSSSCYEPISTREINSTVINPIAFLSSGRSFHCSVPSLTKNSSRNTSTGVDENDHAEHTSDISAKRDTMSSRLASKMLHFIQGKNANHVATKATRVMLPVQKANELRRELLHELALLQADGERAVEDAEAQVQQFVKNVLVDREGLSEAEVAFFMQTLQLSNQIDPETGVILSVSPEERQRVKEEEMRQMKEMDEKSGPVKTKKLDQEAMMRVLLAKGISKDEIQSIPKLRNLLGEDEFDEEEMKKQQERHRKQAK